MGSLKPNEAAGSIITQSDMQQRFGEAELIKLTDRAKTRAIDSDVLQQAINDAEAEAGSYLAAAGFRLPFAAPHTLKVKVCDIARWYLYDNGIAAVVQTRYDHAIAWLKAVVRNPAMLGLEADSGQVQAAARRQIVVIPNQLGSWKDADTSPF
ncbi:gp436 family protein [Kingella oralis]|uniref:gp436 family protein n=1 Tax=Kingella oralis TaxID=505 RepID=UPI0034E5D857